MHHPVADMAWEPIMAEKTLEFEILPGVRITDKSDGMVRMKDSGSIWSLEYKTTAYLGYKANDAQSKSDFLAQFRLDPQIDTHVVAARANGYDCIGVRVVAVEFKKLPQPTTRKCAEHKIEQRVCWPTHARTEIFPFQRHMSQLGGWETEAKFWAQRYKDLLVDNSRPRRPSSKGWLVPSIITP